MASRRQRAVLTFLARKHLPEQGGTMQLPSVTLCNCICEEIVDFARELMSFMVLHNGCLEDWNGVWFETSAADDADLWCQSTITEV